MNSPKGVLVLNLGTPNELTLPAVKSYLNAFLMDPYVIDIPYLARLALVKGIILNTRPKKTLNNFKKIWTDQGSPLFVYTKAFAEKLGTALGTQVEFAMNCSNPNIAEALAKFKFKGITDIVVFPLFPQRAFSTTMSLKEKIFSFSDFQFQFIESYHHQEFYISALSKVIGDNYNGKGFDHLVLSFHGIPVRHITKEFVECNSCSKVTPCSASGSSRCYARQCMETANSVAHRLGLKKTDYTVAFQSRFGSAKWTGPSTSGTLENLGKMGKKRVAVSCPSFATDCLETLEEIQIGLGEEFKAKFSGELHLIPCLNDDKTWVQNASAYLQTLI